MHYIIIPIKSLLNSKKRLEPFLTPNQRRTLVLDLLKDVISAATKSKLTDGILLVTPDTAIIETIRKWDFPKIQYLLEPEELGTNQAVQFAILWCLKKPISSILIIPADLPLLTATDIDQLIQLGESKFPLIIAPSQRKDGTNAFYQRPPDLIQVWYGNNSYQKNLGTISSNKIPFKIMETPAFALDIDLKEDLIALRDSHVASNTFEFCKTLSF
jgi:2-phospho-L-lactate guanylyltransferase